MIGFVFGSGMLSNVLLNECNAKNVNYVCAMIDNNHITKTEFLIDSKNFKVTQIPEIINFFKKHNVDTICIAGAVKKPKLDISLFKINNIQLIWKMICLKNKGDNFLLSTILSFIEQKGFKVISAGEFVPSLLAKEGFLTTTKPSFNDEKSIDLGIKFLYDISKYDISQACVVKNNCIIALEGIEGTAQMIARMQEFNENEAILVKMPKKGQTLKIDMPTIGLETIKQCIKYGIKGIVIKAEETIFLNYEDSVKLANENNIFIYSI